MPEINYALLRYQADNIPTFDGNPKLLQRFIASSENFLKAFQDNENPNAPINICLLDTIYSKLKGRAADLICSRSEINSWRLIKHLIINTFSDQRNIDCLIQDLLSLKINKNEHPINFGMRLQDTRSLLFSKLNATDESRDIKLMKINHYDSFALKTYINNLPFNIQLVVRLKQPESLEQAMSFVQEEENFQQFKIRSNTDFVPKPVPKPNPNNTSINYPSINYPSTSFQTYPFNQNYQNPFQRFSQPNFATNSQNFNRNQYPPYRLNQPNFANNNSQPFPSNPIPITPKPNFNQRFPTNRQVFGKPQNVWKPGNVQPTYKPTPMSVTTRNTNTFQNNQKPTKLFNQEVSENIICENPFEQQITENNCDNQANDYTANHLEIDYNPNDFYSSDSTYNNDNQIYPDIDYTANQSNSSQHEFYNHDQLNNREQQLQHPDFYQTFKTQNLT